MFCCGPFLSLAALRDLWQDSPFPMGTIPDMLTAQLILNASRRPVRWCPLYLPPAFVDA